MAEPGSKKPTASEEPCWAILCPVLYCSANPGQPCMNSKGFFALKTHKLRRATFEYEQARGKSGENGPGSWSRRPNRHDSRDFGHDFFDGQ